MRDNATPFPAKEYDSQMRKTMPYYEDFHNSVIDLVKTTLPNPELWLDTGCGTGSFVQKAAVFFNNTKFFLADPSEKMLEIANRISDNTIQKSTEEIDFPQESFDVITAILSHHYLGKHERQLSTQNCYRILKPKGMYITFENVRFLSPEGISISMNRWWNYKLEKGIEPEKRDEHYARFDNEYHPVTILDHIDLLKECGFSVVEMFWLSHMQAGFFAIK